MYRKGAFAIIVGPDGLLLIIQKPSFLDTEWTFVGGGREDGETSLEGLYRELQEELGLKKTEVKVKGPSKHKIKYDYPLAQQTSLHGGKYNGQEYDCYLVVVPKKQVKISPEPSEIKRHKWVGLADLASYLTFQGQYQNVRLVLNDLLAIGDPNQK